MPDFDQTSLPITDDEKYIVFKRQDFYNRFKFYESLLERASECEIKDAVVIRRQDLFASPCLLTYAAMISMVASNHPSQMTKEELQLIADYFHRQGVLAGEEGYKLPTL